MSSYRGHFHDLSPSDQADIASWSERYCTVCHGSGWLHGPRRCVCDEADFFEILAEQEITSDE